MNSLSNSISNQNTKQFIKFFLTSLAIFAVFFTTNAMAGLAGTDTKVTSFFTNIQTLLTIASISIVTIAIIFAGYQIAFANKRITDVLPILVGGLLIGAAAQIAGMLLGTSGGGGA
jgi:type IV secretion system protein VirB2